MKSTNNSPVPSRPGRSTKCLGAKFGVLAEGIILPNLLSQGIGPNVCRFALSGLVLPNETRTLFTTWSLRRTNRCITAELPPVECAESANPNFDAPWGESRGD
jgi:hypothetical protein